jgi:hypothetical protein
MKVIVMVKREVGEPEAIDEREWTQEMLASIEHANYLVVKEKEYEMVEGRLDLDKGALEVLVVPAEDGEL